MKVHRRLAGGQRFSLALRPLTVYLSGGYVFLLSLTVYLGTLTEVHTYDALSYALDVEDKPWQELFHPHHLAYGPLGSLVLALAEATGWRGRAIVPLQVTNALAGALGVLLFFALVRSVTCRFDLALCGAILLGGSYAYWYYAVEVEVYTIATMFLVLCLWLLVRLIRCPSPGICVMLGLTQGLAVLFHQTNLLLCVPIAAVLIFQNQDPWIQDTEEHTQYRGLSTWWLVRGGWRMVAGARWRLWLAYMLPLGLVVGGCYLLVGFGISRFDSWAAFMDWNTTYTRMGWWGQPVTLKNWSELGRGLASALAHPFGAFLILMLAHILVLYLRPLVRRDRQLVLGLGVWLATYGAFFFWWEPENAEFWIASLPPAFLLVVLALRAGGRRWHSGVWLTLAIGLTMVAGNYQAVVLRGSGAYTPQRAIAHALDEQSGAGDLLIVPDGLQVLYLHYYVGRLNTLALGQLLQTSRGNWESACEHVQQRIEDGLANGVAVLIGSQVLEPALITWEYSDPMLERLKWEQAKVQACFKAYRSALVPLEIGAGLPQYYRLPSAQELGEGAGWDFAERRWGWRAEHVVDEQFQDGWSFVPERDPHITSPRMTIDTSRYRAIQVRLAKGVSNREGQIFFLDRDGIVEEARSVRWQLAGHSKPKTYEVDLRNVQGWTGIISGLRLDPTTGPDHDEGERITLLWLRLIPYNE